MRALLLTFIFSAIFCVAYGQSSFEGEVIYQISCTSKLPNLTDAKLTQLAGDTLRYYMKGANYRSNLNGVIMTWQIYLGHDNKFYDKLPSTDTIYTEDGAVDKDTIYNITIVKNAGTVLGHNCTAIIYNCKSGKQEFWYSSAYHIDSKLYANQKYQHWADYLAKANAMPLKMIGESKIGTETMTAIAVSEKKIPDSLFALPPNPVLLPMP